MAEVERSRRFAESADDMWRRIGDFQGIHAWHPAIEGCTPQEGGDVRELSLAGGGGTVIERRTGVTDHSYSYRILDPGPLPVADYECTIAVRDDADGDGGSVVDWRATFTPSGAPEPDAIAAISGVFEGGLDAL